jgi:hypothetical protein
MARIRALEV